MTSSTTLHLTPEQHEALDFALGAQLNQLRAIAHLPGQAQSYIAHLEALHAELTQPRPCVTCAQLRLEGKFGYNVRSALPGEPFCKDHSLTSLFPLTPPTSE